MVKFRPHKSMLADSMSEAKTFYTVGEMKQYIARNWNWFVMPENIVIDEKVYFDERTGWNTQYVCAKSIGNEKYETPQCIGMCDIKQEPERFQKKLLKPDYFLVTRNGDICSYLEQSPSNFSYTVVQAQIIVGKNHTVDLDQYRNNLVFNDPTGTYNFLDIVEVFVLSRDDEEKLYVETIWKEK